MKKIISILMMCFAFAFVTSAIVDPTTITYYVDANGSNTNDGLSASTPFDSITTALDSAALAYATDNTVNNFVIEVGAGIFTESYLTISNVTLTINGQGANATILQGGEGLTTTAERLLGTCNSISVILNDVAVRNYGASSGTAASSALMDLEIAGRNLEANRVAFSNITGSYAVISRVKNSNDLIFNDCSFTDITATNQTGLFFIPGVCTTEFYNCFFYNCVREYTSGTAGSNFGIILQSNPNDASNTVTFINNTFVSCGLVNTAEITIARQGLVFTKSQMTFTNNIIIDSKKADASDYRDVIAYNGGYDTVSCANNIFGSLAATDIPLGCFSVNNFISDTLKLTSPELNFKMDGAVVDLDTTATGIVYATAMGDSVVGQASALTQTSTDIIGAARAIPGCVGAVEYDPGVPTILESAVAPSVALYPNPVQDVLHITGDVVKAEFFNISGRMVQSSTLLAGNVNVSSLAQGVYFVKCQNEAGSLISTERILKK